MIDVKIRWKRPFLMLQRFYQVKNCIFKSLIDVGSTVSFEEYELNLICNLIKTLEPIKLACDSFFRRDATLLSADTTLSFMIDNLAKRFKEFLSCRINERRNQCENCRKNTNDERYD